MTEQRSIKCYLPFCEKGKWDKKEFDISFLSSYHSREIEDMVKILDELGNLDQEKKATKEDKEALSIIDRRDKLLIDILESNGYEGEVTNKFLSRNCQDGAIWAFLIRVKMKDIGEKQKESIMEMLDLVDKT